MKLKYYLRGAGVGVIVTTLILMIAFHVTAGKEEKEPVPETEQSLTIAEALSEKESSEESPALKKETEETVPPAETKETEETKPPAETEETGEAEETKPPMEKESEEEIRIVEFRIYSGQSPAAVAKNLMEAGIIEDEDAFYRYLVDNGLNDLLEVGTFSLPQNGEFSEIAKILTTNEYERRNAQ